MLAESVFFAGCVLLVAVICVLLVLIMSALYWMCFLGDDYGQSTENR